MRKDGSRFWANVVLTAIHDTTGAVTGFAKVTRDVTEQKQAQESVIAELSGLLLANVDIRKMLGAFSASIQQMFPTTPPPSRSLTRPPASCGPVPRSSADVAASSGRSSA